MIILYDIHNVGYALIVYLLLLIDLFSALHLYIGKCFCVWGGGEGYTGPFKLNQAKKPSNILYL